MVFQFDIHYYMCLINTFSQNMDYRRVGKASMYQMVVHVSWTKDLESH